MHKNQNTKAEFTRRDFLKTAGLSAAILAAGPSANTLSAAVDRAAKKPNILFIITDQQHINTIAAGGCPHVQTPAMDRLYKTGTRFENSYCTSPVCIPARSSLFTGRMPTETGMWFNSARAGQLEPGMPTLGQWLRDKADYQTAYAGKWHVPHCHTYTIPGFDVLASGSAHWGETSDDLVSQACAQYILNYRKTNPFLLVCSLIQPHDICVWLSLNKNAKDKLPHGLKESDLPPIPENFDPDTAEPPVHQKLRDSQQPAEGKWTELDWRYYLWAYYRHVEMVDAQVQRVLDALDQSPHAEDTLIVFTADHGEGMAEHHMVRKGYLYDSCTKVPLIFALPGAVRANRTDSALVSGLDITPTLCDFAGTAAPPQMRGISLKPILTGNASKTDRPHGDFIVTEKGSTRRDIDETGRMLRTPQYKYIKYYGNETDQLFDMTKDPGETQNLSADPAYKTTVTEHRELLKKWESALTLAPRVIKANGQNWSKL